MKTIKSKVKDVLTSYPDTRDDNAKLINWYYMNNCDILNNDSYLKFIGMLIRKEIPSIETLTRLSRQIQQQEPSLRGENWEYRKHIQSKKVQKDLGYTVKN